jgi:glycosyltransferase involved in cell wall biosynthesis
MTSSDPPSWSGGGKERISVIMIVRNGANYLAEAIESVLSQSLGPFETIVVDDGSTDATAAVARQFEEISLVHQPPSGIAAARNHGIDLARGELIAFLDHDDVWLESKLEKQLELVREHEGMCFSTTLIERVVDKEGAHPNLLTRASETSGFGPSALMAPAALFDLVGTFDERLSVGTDSDWFVRVLDNHIPHLQVPLALVRKRLHQGNASARASRVGEELFVTLRRSLERKRADGA